MRRARSFMLIILAVAMLASVGVLGWKKAQFLALARYFREHASRYAQAEALHAGAIAEITNVELEIAGAEPPSARADDFAWRAYRRYLSDLQAKVKVAKSSLDAYDRYRALHRYAERLAAEYEHAATRPWIGMAARSTPTPH